MTLKKTIFIYKKYFFLIIDKVVQCASDLKVRVTIAKTNEKRFFE